MTMTLLFNIRKLHKDAVIPEYATEYSAGLDLSARIDEPVTLSPGKPSVLIGTGIAIHLNHPNEVALILPRSGKGHKLGLVLGNGTGVIDADYQGELFISACVRPGHEKVVINSGDKIAQLVIMPISRAKMTVVDTFDYFSTRGEGGFGSTGV